MEYFQEILTTPVLAEYDIIVCGGGVAGLAAAVAARRHGASVLVIEKTITLGGLATNGLISWYEPICNGQGKRIMNGMAFELLNLSIENGYHTLPEEWMKNTFENNTEKRFSTHFSHSLFAMALDRWLLDSGAKLLLDTVVTAPIIRDHHIEGIIVENKTGRSAYKAKVIVDASGDADIAVRMGIPYEDGENYLTYVSYYTDSTMAYHAAEADNMFYNYCWMNVGSDLWGKGHPEDIPTFMGINTESETQFVLEGRRRLFEKVLGKKGNITALPAMAQYRKSRRIIGKETIDNSSACKTCKSSIGVLPDFVHAGVFYEIPYEILYSPKVNNLFAAGRIVSATGWAWDATRVIPGAVTTGQACGTAAALCVEANLYNDTLPIDKLQEALQADGVWLHN